MMVGIMVFILRLRQTVFLTTNGTNQEAFYDFDSTKFFTFGVAHESIYSRNLALNGSNDNVKFDDVNNLNTTSFSMMFWLRQKGVNTLSTDGTIVSKYDGTTGYRVYLSSNGKLNVSWSGGATLTSSVATSNDIWQNIAIIYSSGYIKLYIDGVLDSTISSSAPAANTNIFSLIKKIDDTEYGLVVVNYANGDMVGHTGNEPAAIEAVEALDKCLGKLIDKALSKGYEILLTADHGNCEEMVDFKNGVTNGADCFHCHGGELAQQQNLNMGGFANNGLDVVHTDKGLAAIDNKSTSLGVFKTPSLLNIEKSGPYMHDGRFKTLEEVIEFYNSGIQPHPQLSDALRIREQGGLTFEHLGPVVNFDFISNSSGTIPQRMFMTGEEKSGIVAFLRTLTDYTMISDPKFSDPFQVVD